MTRRLLTAFLCLLGVGLASPAARAAADVGMEWHAGIGAEQIRFGDAVLSGSGTRDGTSATYRAPARALGLVKPWAMPLSFGIRLIFWHRLAAGLQADTLLLGHADAPALDPGIAASVDTHTITGLRVGVDLAYLVPVPWVSVRPGLIVGYRETGVPITAFDRQPCGKAGLCYPSAQVAGLSVEPRLWVVVPVTPGRLLNLVAYVGGELLTPQGVSAGGGLALHMDSIFQRRRRY